MRKSILLTIVLLALGTTQLFAVGEARLLARVVDGAGNPVPDATITVVATEAKTFSETFKSDKNGDVKIFLLDGTISYKFTVEKEGLRPYQEIIKLRLVPEKNERTFTLLPPTAAVMVEAKADPAIAAYNAGVELFNEGKDAEAVAKFQEAVTARPDLTAGYKTLAIAYLRMKDYPKAIEAANKTIELGGEDSDVAAVLADSYQATGDKAKAAEYRKKAPANAGLLFNEAAKLINAGKDAEAEPLLKQSIAADEKFGVSYYELGMLYVRMGKNADAKANLEKYLELEPKGKDAATARDMMKYLQ